MSGETPIGGAPAPQVYACVSCSWRGTGPDRMTFQLSEAPIYICPRCRMNASKVLSESEEMNYSRFVRLKRRVDLLEESHNGLCALLEQTGLRVMRLWRAAVVLAILFGAAAAAEWWLS